MAENTNIEWTVTHPHLLYEMELPGSILLRVMWCNDSFWRWDVRIMTGSMSGILLGDGPRLRSETWDKDGNLIMQKEDCFVAAIRFAREYFQAALNSLPENPYIVSGSDAP